MATGLFYPVLQAGVQTLRPGHRMDAILWIILSLTAGSMYREDRIRTIKRLSNLPWTCCQYFPYGIKGFSASCKSSYPILYASTPLESQVRWFPGGWTGVP